MVDREYIYVAEAYDKHGERVERIAHTTRDGAVDDIETHAEGSDDEWITNVCPLRLYGGPDGKVTHIETATMDGSTD